MNGVFIMQTVNTFNKLVQSAKEKEINRTHTRKRKAFDQDNIWLTQDFDWNQNLSKNVLWNSLNSSAWLNLLLIENFRDHFFMQAHYRFFFICFSKQRALPRVRKRKFWTLKDWSKPGLSRQILIALYLFDHSTVHVPHSDEMIFRPGQQKLRCIWSDLAKADHFYGLAMKRKDG